MAQLVAAADGPVLADPVLRKAFDALRPRVSDQLGCVIDAALAADAVAVAGTRTTGAVIAIAAASPPPACPALSRVADDLWVATIGDATVAPAREASVLAVSRWARARRYIEDAPVALAIDLGGAHLVAAAQVAPFQAWATLDAPPAIAAFAEARLRARLDGWRIAGAAPAAKVRAERAGGQLVVRADSLDADELGKLAPALLDDLVDPPPPPRAAPRLECPDRKIVERCTGPTSFDVVSVSGALAEMLFVPTTPVAASGAVIGLRLEADPPLLLRRGDIVLGIDGVPVRAQRDLVQLVEDRSRTRAAVAVRRAGVDLVVTLAGHIE
ncbi:MAG: hypothetical protein ACM31C_21520 [Acidobacteriota bacterium]